MSILGLWACAGAAGLILLSALLLGGLRLLASVFEIKDDTHESIERPIAEPPGRRAQAGENSFGGQRHAH